MKYKVTDYGRALAEAILAGRAPEAQIRKNFLALISKNGDEAHAEAVLKETERILRAKDGTRRVVLESARPLSPAASKALYGILKKTDAVEEKLNPALVAGVRVTVNDELQWDGSLVRKIQKLFAYQ